MIQFIFVTIISKQTFSLRKIIAPNNLDDFFTKQKTPWSQHMIIFSRQYCSIWKFDFTYKSASVNKKLCVWNASSKYIIRHWVIVIINSEISEEALCDFCCVYGLKNLVKNPTCFKNIDNPSCIDLILTNKSGSFQNTLVIETGLSDFHRLTVTVMKVNFQKQVPKILYYRNMKHFDNELFRNDFYQELSKYDALNIECIHFEEIFLKTFNVHAPLKKRFLRAK